MHWLLASILISAASLNSTINDIPESGGVIELKKETVVLTEPIVINKSNITINGNGATLKLADNSNCPVIAIGDTATPPLKHVENVVIDDLVIDGNGGHQLYEGWGGPVDTGGKTFIRNNGINIRGSKNIIINNVEVYNARSGGIVTEKGTEFCTISNCDLHHNIFDGLAGCETTKCTFIAIYCHDNTCAGFSCDIRYNENRFFNCNFSNNKSHGMFMRYANDNYFKNVIVKDNKLSGIFISQVNDDKYTAAKGNKLYQLELSGNKVPEILIMDKSCSDNEFVSKPSPSKPLPP